MRQVRGFRHGGFTLTELLVVVAIIAILAGILLPILARAKEQGRQTKCAANLAQLAKAARMYASDWDGGFPPQAQFGDHCLIATWQGYLTNYIRDARIYVCPSARATGPGNTFCYAWNHNLSGQPEAVVYLETKTFMFYDSADYGTAAEWDTGDPPDQDEHYDNFEGCCEEGWYDVDPLNPDIKYWGYMRLRHNGLALVVYVDAHVGSVKNLWCGETTRQWKIDVR